MAVIDIFVFAGGIVLGVYGHDWILKTIQGAEKFVANLKAKATALEADIAAKAAAIKAAVK